MLNMIPIAYLNENFMDWNENLAWGKQEPLFIPACFRTQQRGESSENFILLLFMITFKSFQIIFFIEYQHTSTVEHW